MQITVSAVASSSFPPERATVHLRLGFEGGDKQHVLSLTTALAQALGAEATRLGTMTPSPTTRSAVLPIGTRSWRPWSNDGVALPMRHEAACRANLEFRDFTALSAFVDRWGGRDGVTIQHVEWTLTDDRRAEEQDRILSEAVRNATHRAAVMARAAGAGEVELLEVADPGFLQGRARHSGYEEAIPRSAMLGSSMDEEGVELQPEDIELVAVIDARFTTG